MTLRIVLVMVEPPLPFGHPSGRWYHVLLRGLIERGHSVTAFATCGRPGDAEKARALFPAPRFDLRCFSHPELGRIRSKLRAAVRPFSYMFSDSLRAELRASLGRGFDVLHLEQLWAGWLGLDVPERSIVNVQHLYQIDLSAAPPPASLRERTSRWLQLRTERRLIGHFDHFLAVSPRLATAVNALNPRARVTAVPITIDPTLYPFREHMPEAPVISLVGNMGWHPSRGAAERLLRRLWPEIRRRVPSSRLEIVGWGARSALAEHLDAPGVSIAENVPDVRPYLERAALCVYAPPQGSGMKIKILEALATGLPVVTNAEGAEGLPALDGVHMALAEDDAGLIERTVALLEDRGARERLARGGRALVESACAPDLALDLVEGAYETLLRS